VCLLVEERKLALLGRVASGTEVLKRLLASQHLAAAYNATVLVLDKVSLLEATGGVLRRSMENLGLRTDCGHMIHLILRTRILICWTGGDGSAYAGAGVSWCRRELVSLLLSPLKEEP
jgi:hypothetical protein